MQELTSKTPSRRSRLRPVGLRMALVVLVLAPVVALLGHALLDRGIIWFQEPDPDEFPTRGLDVSHHQGIVDFKRVQASGFSFVYVKATEGATHVDSRFRANWTGARAARLAVGAYRSRVRRQRQGSTDVERSRGGAPGVGTLALCRFRSTRTDASAERPGSELAHPQVRQPRL
ncbi:MAG: hypothetical protein IPK13_16020 [Deltaproteobacteria bacterium]|nr:hypothetical protein [Deltaproteobacteria bacterium]